MKKRSISIELAMAEIAIENSLNHPDTLKKLSVYSYDRKQLMKGKVLKEELALLESAKQDRYGQQFESSDDIKARYREILQCYRQHSKRARLAFEGKRGVQEQLQLLGPRKTDINGLMGQIRAFYQKIAQYEEEIARYAVSPEEIAQCQAMVEAFMESRQQQALRKGEAQHATHQRNAKRKELHQWMKQFRNVARIALADEPQMLETLGIVVPSQSV